MQNENRINLCGMKWASNVDMVHKGTHSKKTLTVHRHHRLLYLYVTLTWEVRMKSVHDHAESMDRWIGRQAGFNSMDVEYEEKAKEEEKKKTHDSILLAISSFGTKE